MTKQTFDFEKWQKRLLEIKDPKNHAESLEFWELIDCLDNIEHIDKNMNIARVLFRTFTNKNDHGVKESVVNTLGLFDIETYYRVYFEELPNLYINTDKTSWFFLMAIYPGREMNYDDADVVVSLCKEFPAKTQELFKKVLSMEDILDDYDWAEYMLGKLIN